MIKARLNLYLNYVAVAALALLPLGGCTAEEERADGVEVLTVQMEGDPTRVTLTPSTGSLTWTSGDQIAVLTTSAIRTCDVDVATNKVIVPLNSVEMRQGYAVYPASAVSTLTTSSVVVTYPASYDISDDLTSEQVPIPMVAVNSYSSNTLTFRHVGGFLRINATLPAGTASVVVTTTGDPIVGNARVTNPGTTQATSTITGGSNSVTFTVHATGLSGDQSVILNIPVPCGSYTGITVTAYNSSHAEIVSFTDEAGRFVDHRTATALDATALLFPSKPVSVSATKKVCFSPGNLMAKIESFTSDYAIASEWKFGEYYEVYSSSSTGGTYLFYAGNASCVGKWVDMYSWQGNSCSDSRRLHGLLRRSNDTQEYNGNIDGESLYDGCWNGLPISNGGGYNWYPLSSAEWAYLLNTRTVTNSLSAGARYTMATIGGSYKGLIIFPDNYTHPAGTGFVAGVFNGGSNYTATVPVAGWELMQKAGCVFLIVTGWRTSGSSFSDVTTKGLYWTSTGSDYVGARDLNFQSGGVNPADGSHRYRGFAVRLVRDVN